jgi:hypothetical protein
MVVMNINSLNTIKYHKREFMLVTALGTKWPLFSG